MTEVVVARIKSLVDEILEMWGGPIQLEKKTFGPLETYSCEPVSRARKRVSEMLDAREYDELLGIVEFHVGKMALEASKYVTVLRPLELDRELILKEVCAREELPLLLLDNLDGGQPE